MRDIEQLVAEGVEVHAMWLQPYSQKWSVTLKQKVDGVELNVSAQDKRLDHAIEAACGKWDRISRGVTEFNGPLLEHVRPAPAPVDIDDDIPF